LLPAKNIPPHPHLLPPGEREAGGGLSGYSWGAVNRKDHDHCEELTARLALSVGTKGTARQSGEGREFRMRCDRCKRQDAFASEWDVHVSFALGQILCPQCYLRAGSWREAELTPREAERLRAAIHITS
jgi:hypothetical protein